MVQQQAATAAFQNVPTGGKAASKFRFQLSEYACVCMHKNTKYKESRAQEKMYVTQSTEHKRMNQIQCCKCMTKN